MSHQSSRMLYRTIFFNKYSRGIEMAIFWKDIDIELRKQNNGDILDMTNSDAITNSLKNIFTTFQGSRRMVPYFALPIHNLLFEPMDEFTANRLGELIWDAVTRWETRIIVEGLNVVADEDNNQYEVYLNYYIGNTGNQDSLQTFTNIIRAS